MVIFVDVQKLDVNIIDVNTLHCREERDHKILFKYNCVKFSSTSDQENEVKARLTSTGLVIDVEPIQQDDPASGTYSADATPTEEDSEGVILITTPNLSFTVYLIYHFTYNRR